MATTSFEKTFVVSNPSAIEQIRKDLAQPRIVKVNRRDFSAESKKGIELLRQRLSNLAS